MDIIQRISQELTLRPHQVAAAVELIDQGNTIPFIARYRKEATDSLDDTQLRALDDRLTYLRSLEKRRGEISAALQQQEQLTDALAKALDQADTLARLEDLYRPYRPKRRTRASIARERGLEPLAQRLWEQTGAALPLTLAQAYVDPEKEVPDAAAALDGARDILAEWIADDPAVRELLRRFLWQNARVVSSSQEAEGTVYQGYGDFSEPVNRIAGHRVLALDRGEREEVLKVTLQYDRERAQTLVEARVVHKGFSPSREVVGEAVADALPRLILPSLEREVRASLTQAAAEQAIGVFAANLRPLLMQPPVRGKVALGLDPAYRTGCKVAVVDPTGRVLDTTVIYPTKPHNKVREAADTLEQLVRRHGVQVLAIGNGTAGRETEQFAANTIRERGLPVQYMVVSEAGASVYSASKLGAEEFPQYDVALRSAVSIARRLQDPLAELVKIDPKAIGVGQYQHDMPPARLDSALEGVVEDCVNRVGVDVNTASPSLLQYVAGIGPSLARKIVLHREENGSFPDRKSLLKVSGLGKKAYQQAAGFLRVPESADPLDNTAVHPESYPAAKALLRQTGHTLGQTGGEGLANLPGEIEAVGWEKMARQLDIGEPTLRDMVAELLRPGRDPREALPPPLLRTDVLDLKDLKPGMILEGTVRNVIDFGAFVDIGVHQDGLVHISQLGKGYVKHPSQVVQVGDIVRVQVLEIDQKRGRISLTMQIKEPDGAK